MRVKKARVSNFKRLDSYELDLIDPLSQRPRDLTVLVGENGSGKTTLLQAIALPLSVATRRIRKVQEFQWPGFVFERLNPLTTRVELDVVFDRDELRVTSELAAELERLGAFEDEGGYKPPSMNEEVTLYFKHGRVLCDTPEELFQFRGRDYAKQLARLRGYEPFKKVGSVFWYDQERKATSLTRVDSEPTSIEALRDQLSRWWTIHTNVRLGKQALSSRDLYGDLQGKYQTVFKPRRLVGVESRGIPGSEGPAQDFWFMLDDTHRYYDLDEMSSGERAVFPVLFDFVKWDINRSIVLLDEIELHLHPPLQQFLVESLPRLGHDNQFIITTHSEEVLNVIPESVIHRIGT